jgi:hypothetical protein
VVFLCTGSSWAQQDSETVIKALLLKVDWIKVGEAAQQWKQRDADAPVADWLLGDACLATGDYNRSRLTSFSRLDPPAKLPALLDYASVLASENSKNSGGR